MKRMRTRQKKKPDKKEVVQMGIDYKSEILRMISEMQNEEYLKNIYYYILYPYQLEKK